MLTVFINVGKNTLNSTSFLPDLICDVTVSPPPRRLHLQIETILNFLNDKNCAYLAKFTIKY